MRLANWEGQELGRVSRWVGERKRKKERERGRKRKKGDERGREERRIRTQISAI